MKFYPSTMETQLLDPAVECIMELSLKKFESLPKTGKPLANEWTVLSTIVEFDSNTTSSKVVALGTGTKSIGYTSMCPLGQILNDSHAEVIARRAFIRYIFNQMKISNSEILSYNESKRMYQIKNHISYHFFSTQSPCGDACIDEKTFDTINCNNCSIPPAKKMRKDFENHMNDIYTGAKLLTVDTSDRMHQKLGALRTKPGRGIPSLSMSCSDKISKWNAIGLHGALLDILLEEPIYIKSYNFCCSFNDTSMKRAIYNRWLRKGYRFKLSKYEMQIPDIRQCPNCDLIEFNNCNSKSPSPNSLIWSCIPEDKTSFEVSVAGKKQGVTKKTFHQIESSAKISKVFILQEFHHILRLKPELMAKLHLNASKLSEMTYMDCKNLARDYQVAWNDLKENYFGKWVDKSSGPLIKNK